MEQKSMPVNPQIAADPRFMRASPESFNPQDDVPAPEQRMDVVPPPPGLRTGSVDQIRESTKIALQVMNGVTEETDFRYKSGKHLREGDLLRDPRGTFFEVKGWGNNTSEVVLQHQHLGEVKVTQKFIGNCLLARRKS